MPEYIKLSIDENNIKKSDRKHKKLMTYTPKGKLIHFGDNRYQHYKDLTGIWKELDHNDDERRKRYRARSSKIKDGDGELTYMNPEHPNAWAYWVLW